ncbi:MAG: CapA family protein [Oscillospiraceae bacterium]|nr:CapA family protein [Oscillospiraceae bacterium]
MSATKITVIGDMMCEPLLLKAAGKAKQFDFSPVFSNVRELFRQSDFVIGNLETPLAGEKAGYVSELFTFNAPREFAMAAKEAGISLVSTANNHCMDRGFEGLIETLRALDEIGLDHIGSYEKTGQQRTFFKEINGQRIAVVAYTYGINYPIHHRELSKEQEAHINLLRPYAESIYLKNSTKKTLGQRVVDKAILGFSPENRARIKKALGMPYNTPRKDDAVSLDTAAPYLEQFRADIQAAREQADIVLVLPHVGGQFNPEPGAFTELVIRTAREAGADAVIASHPHIIQRAAKKDGIPCYYSIGNFSMSPNSVYLLHENLPEYGLAVHLYLEDHKIQRTSFSILKIVEKKGGILSVWHVREGSQADAQEIRRVYQMVTGRELTEPVIRAEYEL